MYCGGLGLLTLFIRSRDKIFMENKKRNSHFYRKNAHVIPEWYFIVYNTSFCHFDKNRPPSTNQVKMNNLI